jgi:hypothetical protein
MHKEFWPEYLKLGGHLVDPRVDVDNIKMDLAGRGWEGVKFLTWQSVRYGGGLLWIWQLTFRREWQLLASQD